MEAHEDKVRLADVLLAFPFSTPKVHCNLTTRAAMIRIAASALSTPSAERRAQPR
jgi:hypothetical protein